MNDVLIQSLVCLLLNERLCHYFGHAKKFLRFYISVYKALDMIDGGYSMNEQKIQRQFNDYEQTKQYTRTCFCTFFFVLSFFVRSFLSDFFCAVLEKLFFFQLLVKFCAIFLCVFFYAILVHRTKTGLIVIMVWCSLFKKKNMYIYIYTKTVQQVKQSKSPTMYLLL